MTELLPLQEEDIVKSQLNQKSKTSDDSKPTGVVFDKDGKPCRACTAFKDWTKREKKKQSPNNNKLAAESKSNSSQELPPDCPPDSEQLGRATWTFLHTMAAYYPEVPSYQQQGNMRNLLSAFSQFYPCWYCAEHLRKEMNKIPPRVESKWALGKWLCDMHNIVNERLGKPIFDCKKIDERWKDGPKDGRCD